MQSTTLPAAGLGLAAIVLILGGCGSDSGSSGDQDFGAGEDAIIASAGDDDDDDDDDADDADDDGTAQPGDEDEGLTAAQVRAYLHRIAPTLAGRSLSFAESETIEALGEDAIEPIVYAWTTEPGFAEAVRYLVQTMLHASGNSGGIDYELPGNLAAEIASLGLPWTTILTADYCVDALGNHTDCDTGAPYAAGVLATRAYMAANKGRFNLGRAKLMLETFACRVYPMETQVQIPLDKELLIPMFRAETAEEQEVEEAEGGFGNGIGCYFCHAQFGAHAQLFVKYNAEGLFIPEAAGLQNPDDELGRSFDGLYTSHMFNPLDAQIEASQMFGEPVAGLREAAEVLADSRMFTECTVKNLIASAFGLLAGASADIDAELIAEIADAVTAIDDDPTFAQYAVAVFTDERVVDAVVGSLQTGGE